MTRPDMEPASLVELLCWRAQEQSEQRAYIFLNDRGQEDGYVTYAGLDRRARAIATRLQELAAAGQRVLLLYPPGLEYIAAFFGCLYAGAIAIPIYPPRPNRPVDRLQSIGVDAQASLVLTCNNILTKLHPLVTITPDLNSLHWLATDTLDEELALEWRPPRLDGDSLAFLQYTSGSTASPKGVILRHGHLLHNEHMIQRAFGHTQQSVVMGWLPLYHDMGLIGNVLQSLYLGVPCLLMSPVAFLLKPIRWLQAISEHRATTSGAPNFAYDLCIRKIPEEQRQGLDLSCWKIAFIGSEPVHHTTIQRFAAAFAPCGFNPAAFYPCYGLAEATLFVSGGSPEESPVIRTVRASALEQNRVEPNSGREDTRTLISCGHAWMDQKIAIVDPESEIPCPDGVVGEIWVAGPSVAGGYWNHPEETYQTFYARLRDSDEGPFLRTGDLGFVQDGELFVTGRLKDLLVVRGRNHYPQDIEYTVERTCPWMRPGCGAAFTVEVQGEERLVVVFEINRHCPCTDHLIHEIREAVAKHHELQVYAVALLKTGSIPKTPSGKVRRSACRSAFLRRTLELEAIDDVKRNVYKVREVEK
jgi:acyl-CoA synthetase (AMP-forming)/AMP-acid ligase II